MKKLQIGAILLGGLVAAPLQASMAQTTNVAYAQTNESRPGYVVFFDKGTAQLSSVADQTIRRAAADADRSAGLVRVVGRADYANTVKNELVRDGVPARAIVVVPRTDNPLPTIGDGVSEPANRRVEIKY
jgi:outer membrane protein OmpA-like peptidoglycan-associated protein